MRESKTRLAAAFAAENNVTTLDHWYFYTTEPKREKVELFKNILHIYLDPRKSAPVFIDPSEPLIVNFPVSLRGTIYGDKREAFPDGSKVITDNVVSIEKDALFTPTHPFFVVTTESGTKFYLCPMSEYSVPVLP